MSRLGLCDLTSSAKAVTAAGGAGEDALSSSGSHSHEQFIRVDRATIISGLSYHMEKNQW